MTSLAVYVTQFFIAWNEFFSFCFPFFFRGRDLLVVLLCFYGAFQDTVCIIDAREDYNETDK